MKPRLVVLGAFDSCHAALEGRLAGTARTHRVTLVCDRLGDASGLGDHISVHAGDPVAEIDHGRHAVVTEGGDSIRFDKLIAVEGPSSHPACVELAARNESCTGPAARRERPPVCRCNGVSREEILHAVRTKELANAQQVAEATAAGASCGSCRRAVDKLLERCGTGRPPSSMCNCTDLDHEDVRETIRRRPELQSRRDVMRALGWRTPDGCRRCSPAINFYLHVAHPQMDDPRARGLNEQAHANLQRNGTFSVVPRIFGGVIEPSQLRAIADVAERYSLPMVKITGAQRIDLLGVPGESLPAVWRELNAVGLVSGHAYGRAVRNVKTCVGKDWCRFGIGDAINLGIAIEQMTWNCWTPHKFKLAISACARNCAEATIKDFGAVSVEGGWDLYVGGSAGMRVRAGRRIARVQSEREVMEHCGAFLQLYREEGHYGERTGAFVQRVGMDYVQERLAGDPVDRGVLFRRLHAALYGKQEDPWARFSKKEASDFIPVSRLAGGARN